MTNENQNEHNLRNELQGCGITDKDLECLCTVHAQQLQRDIGLRPLCHVLNDQGLAKLALELKPEPGSNEYEALRKKFQSTCAMYEFNRNHSRSGTETIEATAVVMEASLIPVGQSVTEQTLSPQQGGLFQNLMPKQTQSLFSGIMPQQQQMVPVQSVAAVPPQYSYPTRSMALLQGNDFNSVSCGGFVHFAKPAKKAMVSDAFLSQHPIKQKNGTIFMKRDGHYEILSNEEFSKVIAAFSFSQAQKADSARYLRETQELILADPRTEVGVDGADFGNLVFTADGMVYDLCNGSLTPSKYEFASTYVAIPSAAFTSDGETPTWDYLVNTQYGHLPDDLREKFSKNFKQCIGFMLSSDISRRKIIVLQGATGSGKSTIERVLESVLPPHQSTGIRLSDLSRQFTMAGTGNLRLITVPDMPAKPLSAETVEILKVKSGFDRVSSDVKYKEREEIFFRGKIMLVTNHFISTVEEDPAFEGRLQVVPFFVTPSQGDAGMFGKLMAESPQFVVKCLKAYGEMLVKGEDFAACDYRVNACLSISRPVVGPDYLSLFIKQEIIAEPGGFVPTVAIYYAFTDFAKLHNITDRISFALDNPQAFSRLLGKRMAEMGISKTKQRFNNSKNPVNGYVGISLRVT